MLVALLPMNGVRLWVGLTDTLRWGYTDLRFAIIALLASVWMLYVRVRTRIWLYIIAASALAVIGGSSTTSSTLSIVRTRMTTCRP